MQTSATERGTRVADWGLWQLVQPHFIEVSEGRGGEHLRPPTGGLASRMAGEIGDRGGCCLGPERSAIRF